LDANRFDALARSLEDGFPRRAALGAALGAGFASLLSRFGADEADAKQKRKKRKRKKKIKKNAFGCVNVGNVCKNSGQCCSGICQGKKGKKKCKAHNALDCPIGADTCLEQIECGSTGECFLTTGAGSFCGLTSPTECVVCAKDADCEALGFGVGAACAICNGCETPAVTACVPAAA
jgi:hypothetical protein